MIQINARALLCFLVLYYGVFAVDGNGQPVFRSAVWGSVIVGTNAPRDDGKLKPADLKKWGVSKLVFTGKLTQVVAGPVGRSMPPVYTHRLTFEIDEVLRGKDDATGIEAGGVLNASNIARQKREPTFPEGDTCLVAADFSRGSWRIVHVEKLTKKKLADAKLALKVPFGWSVKDGKLVSPWESLGKQAWPKGQDMNFTLLCEVTGRPAFLIGEAALAVEPVPPKEEIKWTNPDGDGFYSVTVSNPTDHLIEVPALLTSDQGEVLWSESLVILCQGKTYPCPQAQGVAGKLQPTLLKPNEKVSTIVNALALEGPEWPRGGMRVEFQFCLGEKSVTQSFYYMSRHHDAFRDQAKQARRKNAKPKKARGSDGVGILKINSKRGSQVAVSESDGQVQFVLAKPKGIDSLTISPEQAVWPQAIKIRLHTKGLESLRIFNSTTVVNGQVTSTGEHIPSCGLSRPGKKTVIDSTSPYWPGISLVAMKNIIPVEDGYFEFIIPKALLTPESKTLTVEWIDFYRG